MQLVMKDPKDFDSNVYIGEYCLATFNINYDEASYELLAQ